MSKINILDKEVYNKIAAGEVVEKPASVVKELIENSIDAGATNITIEIIDGGITKIKVIDNGCGIEKDRLSSIFTGYHEKKNLHVDAQKHNMGIGLSACSAIIHAHDGTIHAENLSTGGCRFYFTLKLENEAYEQQI